MNAIEMRSAALACACADGRTMSWRRLQPSVMEAATLCGGGCNPFWRALTAAPYLAFAGVWLGYRVGPNQNLNQLRLGCGS